MMDSKYIEELAVVLILALVTVFSTNAQAVCYGSPIVLDLGQNGIRLGEGGVSVQFDINGSGVKNNIQWVAVGGDEAFLFKDRNNNGKVDNGTELFGIGTPIEAEPGVKATDGFVALAQYDQPELGGNSDGKISSLDAAWSTLYLWVDIDANGESVADEILTLSQAGVNSIDTRPKRSRKYDEAGNSLALWSWATKDTHPRKIRTVDVFFVVLPQ
jgi:hypothetical protein